MKQMSRKPQKMNALSFSGDVFFRSQNQEFVFVIYETASKNRKTMAIYRKADGELREVNFILNCKYQKNIGKKIANAIKELRTRPINQLYVKIIQRSPMNALYHVCMTPNAMLEDKEAKISEEQHIYNTWINRGINFEENPTEKRVCNLCLNYKDCKKLYHVVFCAECESKSDFQKRLIARDNQWYKANGIFNSRSVFDGGDRVPDGVCGKCANYYINCKCHQNYEVQREDGYYDMFNDGKCYNINCQCGKPKGESVYIGKTTITTTRKAFNLVSNKPILCRSCQKNTICVDVVECLCKENVDQIQGDVDIGINGKKIFHYCKSCEERILQEIAN